MSSPYRSRPRPGTVEQVLRRGNDRAARIADATLDEVRTAMGMRY